VCLERLSGMSLVCIADMSKQQLPLLTDSLKIESFLWLLASMQAFSFPRQLHLDVDSWLIHVFSIGKNSLIFSYSLLFFWWGIEILFALHASDQNAPEHLLPERCKKKITFFYTVGYKKKKSEKKSAPASNFQKRGIIIKDHHC
jgi:hypothetical protein